MGVLGLCNAAGIQVLEKGNEGIYPGSLINYASRSKTMADNIPNIIPNLSLIPSASSEGETSSSKHTY